MSLKKGLEIIETILKLIKNDINLSGQPKGDLDSLEKIRQRRQNFKIKPFDLGEHVTVDRELIYSERGL